MFKQYLILLFLAHIIADFYMQTEKISEKKDQSIKWVLIHCAYYLGIMLLLILPVISDVLIIGASLGALFHLMIDLAKFLYIWILKQKGKVSQGIDRNIFFADQALHFLSLIGIAYWQTRNNLQIIELKFLADFFNVVGLSGFTLASWTFALLFIHKPANIAIQKLLSIYKPLSTRNDKEELKAGRLIGTVERIIMLILLSIGQFSAIGLVLTAKSIARYDKISKEKDFAEYYLLGTLISTLIVIVVSFLI